MASRVFVADNLITQLRTRDVDVQTRTLTDIFNNLRQQLNGLVTDVNNQIAAIPSGVTGSVSTDGVIAYDETTPTEYSGALSRKLWNKLGDFVSVLDFGADPKGDNDSTPAFTAAINAARTADYLRVVIVPGGTYKLSGKIEVTGTDPAGPVFIMGLPGSELQRDPALSIGTELIHLDSAGCILTGLRITSDGADGTIGVKLTKSAIVRDCVISAFSQSIVLSGADSTVIEGCTINHKPVSTFTPSPPITITNSSGCVIVRNFIVFVGGTNAVTESGTSDTNLVRDNDYVGVRNGFNPSATSSSGALTVLEVQSQENNTGTNYTKSLFVRDNNNLIIADETNGTVVELLNISRTLSLVEATNLVAHGFLGIANNAYSDTDANTVPDTVALLKFRPADDAVDISVTSPGGTRAWAQLFPPTGAVSTPAVAVTTVNVTDIQVVDDKWGPPVGDFTVPVGHNIASVELFIVGPTAVAPLFRQSLGVIPASGFATPGTPTPFGTGQHWGWDRPPVGAGDATYFVEAVPSNAAGDASAATPSADFTVPAIDSPVTDSTMKCTGISIVRRTPVEYNADGIELAEFDGAFTLPVNEDAKMIVITVINPADAGDTDRITHQEMIGDYAPWGGARTIRFGPWIAQNETTRFKFWTYAQDDTFGSPVVYDVVVTVGAGNLNAGRINPGTLDSTNLTINAGKLDIVVGGIGSNELAALSVTAGKIANNTITALQIQNNVITALQIANNTITAGQIQNNTITAGQLANNSVTSAAIANNAVTAGKIDTNAVTSGNIQAGAVTAGKFGSLSIQAGDIADLQITTAKIGNFSVNGVKIAGNAIDNTHVADNVLNGGKITNGTIVGSKIQVASITGDRIGSGQITASHIQAGAITANEIQNLAITTAKIGNFQVTANQIQNLSIDDSKISGLSVSKLSAGTISVSIRITAPQIEVTGSGLFAQIDNVNGIKVTGTSTGNIASLLGGTLQLTSSASSNSSTMSSSKWLMNSPSLGAINIEANSVFGMRIQVLSSGGVSGWTISPTQISNNSFGASVVLTGSGQRLDVNQIRISNFFSSGGGTSSGGFTVRYFWNIYDIFDNFLGSAMLV